jgi:hypothetical protein
MLVAFGPAAYVTLVMRHIGPMTAVNDGFVYRSAERVRLGKPLAGL